MDLSDVRERVLEINASSNDDEQANSLEGKLYVDVLRTIAAGAPDAAGLAVAALESQKLGFHRWAA